MWLAWKPGDGWSIRIGRDLILGMTGLYKLPVSLLEQLLQRRIFYLAQAAKPNMADGFTCWSDAQNLGLSGDEGRVWNKYIFDLKNLGICLSQEKDTLCWSRNLKDGSITAALAYRSMSRIGNMDLIPSWFSKIWKWGLPMKTIIFSWLLIANRILTWDNLLKKGFSGPGICPFCCSEEENVTHIMITCPYTIQVWNYHKVFINSEVDWHGQNIVQAFKYWISAGKKGRTLPFLVCRTIWLARNSLIFRGLYQTPLQICNKVQQVWKDGKDKSRLIKYRYIQQPYLQENMSIRYFDGASQNGGLRCGFGAILISLDLGRFNIKWNCGIGTNTRAELLALWSILHLAKLFGIETIQIIGDSRIIVDWFRGRVMLDSLTLTHWMDRIMQLKSYFTMVNIQHVYREINTAADNLSKLALDGPAGHFLVAPGNGRVSSTYKLLGLF